MNLDGNGVRMSTRMSGYAERTKGLRKKATQWRSRVSAQQWAVGEMENVKPSEGWE